MQKDYCREHPTALFGTLQLTQAPYSSLQRSPHSAPIRQPQARQPPVLPISSRCARALGPAIGP